MFTQLLEHPVPLPPHFTARLNRATASLCVTICTLLLAGCGGGGSSGSSAAAVGIQPSAQFAGVLENKAPGAGPLLSDWSATTCTDNRQKNWVRSWLNEDYLFYRDAPLTSMPRIKDAMRLNHVWDSLPPAGKTSGFRWPPIEGVHMDHIEGGHP